MLYKLNNPVTSEEQGLPENVQKKKEEKRRRKKKACLLLSILPHSLPPPPPAPSPPPLPTLHLGSPAVLDQRSPGARRRCSHFRFHVFLQGVPFFPSPTLGAVVRLAPLDEMQATKPLVYIQNLAFWPGAQSTTHLFILWEKGGGGEIIHNTGRPADWAAVR